MRRADDVIVVAQGLAGPGCWGYPDMLEVGVFEMPARGSLNFLTSTETRTHFAAWCTSRRIQAEQITFSHLDHREDPDEGALLLPELRG